MPEKRILVIIPAFNESKAIKKVIEDIRRLPRLLDILVVDDGSVDATKDAALAAGARVAPLPFNVGIGAAVQTGFCYAQKHGYDIALQVDGDGQHDAGFIENILEPLLADQADMVVGSRFISPFTSYCSSLVRRAGIQFFSGLLSALTRYQVTDPTSGFRACNRKMIALFADEYPKDYPEPEAIMVAQKNKARFLEVPVQMHKRAHGHSSIRYLYTLYYMIKVTFAILLHLLPDTKEA